MGRKFNSIASDYYYTNNVGLPGENLPIGLSVWFKPSSVAGIQRIVGWTVGSNQKIGVQMSGSSVYAVAAGNDNPTPVTINLGTVVNNTWNHVFCYFASGTYFDGILNAGSGVSYGGFTGTYISNTGFRVGAINSGESNVFNGEIAEIGIWNVNPITDIKTLLANGLIPWGMSPDALKGYYPLTGAYDAAEHSWGENPLDYLLTTDILGTPKGTHSPTISFMMNSPPFNLITMLSKVIETSGISSEEVFGSLQVNLNLLTSGIPSEEVFGVLQLNLHIEPSGIPSEEAFGIFTISKEQELVPVGIPSEEVFGAISVNRGTAIIHPFGIGSEEAFGNLQITTAPITLEPSGILSGEVFGSLQVNLNLLTSGIPSEEVFGLPGLLAGTVNLTLEGIPSEEAFGSLVIQPETVYITPGGISSAEVFGLSTIYRGNVTVVSSGIPSAEVFGQPEIEPGLRNVTPSGIPSEEVFGLPGLLAGNTNIEPSGIPSEEAFGIPILTLGNVFIVPSGISSEEAFGVATTSVSEVFIQPVGISSEESFGQPEIERGSVDVTTEGIPSEEVFGTPGINYLVYPGGITSEEIFGNCGILTGVVDLKPEGIPSEEGFGSLVVRHVLIIDFIGNGIQSEEAFGAPFVFTFENNDLQNCFEEDLFEAFYDTDEFADKGLGYIYFKKLNNKEQKFKYIFDNEYVSINNENSEVNVQSRTPTLRVIDKFIYAPSRGDLLVIRGVRYKIVTYEPDGVGEAIIILQRERTSVNV